MSAISSCCSLRGKHTLPVRSGGAAPGPQPRSRPQLTSSPPSRGPAWPPPRPLCGRLRWARRRGRRSARPWRLPGALGDAPASGSRCPAVHGRWPRLPLPGGAARGSAPSLSPARGAGPGPPCGSPGAERRSGLSGPERRCRGLSGGAARSRSRCGAGHSPLRRPRPVRSRPAPAPRLNVSNVRPLRQSAHSSVRAGQSPLVGDAAATVTAGRPPIGYQAAPRKGGDWPLTPQGGAAGPGGPLKGQTPPRPQEAVETSAKRLYWGPGGRGPPQDSGGPSGGGASPPRRSVSMCFCIFSVIHAGGTNGFSSSSRRSTESLGREGVRQRPLHPPRTPSQHRTPTPSTHHRSPTSTKPRHLPQSPASTTDPQPAPKPNPLCPPWTPAPTTDPQPAPNPGTQPWTSGTNSPTNT